MKTIEELIEMGLVQYAQHNTGQFNEVIPCFYVLKRSFGEFASGGLVFSGEPYFERDILNERWQKIMFASHWEGWG
jgi:hypothetical protein